MDQLLGKLLKKPLLVLGLILAVSAGLFSIMRSNSYLETDLDKYMPQNHKAFVYSNEAEEWFDIKDGIIIAIENEGGIYNPGTLEKIKAMTKDLSHMDEIEKNDIMSLYTADNIVGSDFGLEVDPFYKRVPQSASALSKISEDVRSNEMVYKRIVSEDEEVTLIIAEIKDDFFSDEFYRRILDLAASYEGPENLYVAGRPIVEGTMATLAPADMQKMVPIVISIIALVLLLVMRSLKATLLTLAVVLFSVLWSFGLMALLNVPIYAVSTMLPVMLIAIGVADGIHLFNHLKITMAVDRDLSKVEAVKHMIEAMWKPVVMTSLTTAIGFVSLLTSQVYPIKYFGLFTAFGVIMAMVFSLVLIPAGIMVFGLPDWKAELSKSRNESRKAKGFADLLLKYKKISIILTGFIFAFALWGMSRVWIDSSFLSQFEKDSDIVRTDAFINDKFGGTSTLNVIFDSEEEEGFKNPQILRALSDLQDDVDGKLEVVGNSFSLADYLKRMNKVMHEDDPSFNIIPESRELIAQYLLLYEMSGDPEKLWQVVDYNFAKTNMTFQLKSDNSKALKETIEIIESHSDILEGLGVTMNYAGSGYKGLVFTDLILEGQIWSIVLSLVLVIVLLSLMFRNVVVGLIGSVPIIITASISFGVMGLLNIPLSTTTALLTSIAIGIGIDYAVHFIERYRIYAIATGDRITSFEKAMSHSGKAIFFNALVVIAGFLVLLFSLFPVNRSLGALVSLNMFTSFTGTLTIMAILLIETGIYIKHKENKQEKKMKKGKITIITLMLMMLSLPAAALENATGLEIIEKVYNRSAPDDQKGDLEMILENSRGDQRIRNISQYITKGDDIEKKIMFFNAPADVRNTSFMNWSYTGQDKEDSQWIYLPALRKVKRISSGSSSDYFMGSDFTYDDLGDRRPREDSHRLTGEEMIDGEMCYVVESIPRDDDYMYSKTLSWIAPGKWLVIKKVFYDGDGEELKTLKAIEYREIEGYWMIIESEMHNLQKDHKTGMKFRNLVLDSGIEDRIFSERVMMRGIR